MAEFCEGAQASAMVGGVWHDKRTVKTTRGEPRQLGIAVSDDHTPIQFDSEIRSSTALVFVHGWCCNRQIWTCQINAFGALYTTVCLDLAGHGGSGRYRNEWTIPAFGGDVIAVIEKLRLSRVILIGHSMGGGVIVEAARRRPDLISGLVGVDTWQHVTTPRSPRQVQESLVNFRSDFRAATKAHARSMFTPTVDMSLANPIIEQMVQSPSDIALEVLEAYRNHDHAVSQGLLEAKCPKYVINSSTRLTIADGQLHGICVLYMVGAGHFAMMEDPQAFNTTLGRAIEAIVDSEKDRIGVV